MKTEAEIVQTEIPPSELFQYCLDEASDYCDEVGDTYLFMFWDGSMIRTNRDGTQTETF